MNARKAEHGKAASDLVDKPHKLLLQRTLMVWRLPIRSKDGRYDGLSDHEPHNGTPADY